MLNANVLNANGSVGLWACRWQGITATGRLSGHNLHGATRLVVEFKDAPQLSLIL